MIYDIALVTGGAGFIGSHLVDALLRSGHDVRVIDNLTSGSTSNLASHLGQRRFQFIRGSITDRALVKKVLKDVDVVFHLAALLSVTESVASPVSVDRVNTRGTLIVLDEARRVDVKRVAFASSAAVYGSGGRPPIAETSSLAPDSPYGAAKIAGEAYCNAFHHSYGIETVILRYFNVYGPRSRRGPYSGVMTQFADRAASGRPLEIFGDGHQTRDFVYVRDVVRATMLASISPSAVGGSINIGTGKPTTINKLADLFARSGLGPIEVPIIHREPRLSEIRHSVASIRRARRVLGYYPRTSLADGVGKFTSWYKGSRTYRNGIPTWN